MNPIPGIEAEELTPEGVASALAGELTLAPIVLTEMEQRLQRAGFPVVSERAAARDELKGMS